jgi:DNA-binding LacI/PurR family transcriptional regulator
MPEADPNRLPKPLRADRPARQQVAWRVKELIRARGLRTGDRLPSYDELVRKLAFSLVTVKRGMDDLVEEGIIHRQNGRGTFVAKELALVPRDLRQIGVIYPSSREQLFHLPYLSEILRGMAQKAPPQADTHIFSLRQDGMVNAAQIGEWDVSGAILLDMENDDYLRTFAQWGTPGVVVDYCSQAAPLDYVACDNRAAVQRVVEHLAALGHCRVAYMAPPSKKTVKRPDNVRATLLVRESSDVRERRDESLHALRERGMLADVWCPLHLCNDDDWATTMANELQRRIRVVADCPTAVLTDSNYSACALLEAFARCGLHAPEDVSVCAVASDSDAMFEGRCLTCCRFDFVGMGRKAIELLAVRCREPGLEQPCVHRIGFEFVEGQTVRSFSKT